jgi:hypothetical protein
MGGLCPAALAHAPETALRFDEVSKPDILALELHRDGVLPAEPHS